MTASRGPRRGLFDVWSHVYDIPLVQWTVYRPEQEAVVRALETGPHGVVLDLGCGTGQLADRLRRLLPDARVTGCDFSSGMLARAAARGPAGSWVCGDAGRLPFTAAVFDAVVSTEAFHWFPDPTAVLGEIARVLRPEGRLLLTLVTPPLAVVGQAAGAVSRALGQPLRWPTAGGLRARLAAAGFTVERQRYLFRLPWALLLPPTLTVARRGPA